MKAFPIILLFIISFISISSRAQTVGCMDSSACNFNPEANFDDGLCVYEPLWFIPEVPTDLDGNSPAIFTCGIPEGYTEVIQSCIIEVIADDDFCTVYTWDAVCQNNYEACLEEVTACTDETACNFMPSAVIDDGSCVYEPLWYIPIIPTDFFGSSPAVLNCGPLDGYVLADQCCVSALVVADDFCVDITWDQACQAAYDECIESGNVLGCADPEACNYVQCVNISNGTCNYEQWYIPDELGIYPIVLSCSAIDGYSLANQCAIETTINNDPFCVNEYYDIYCQNYYNSQLENLGCTDIVACNYDFFAICDSGECDYSCLGCTDSAACNYDPTAIHVENYCDYFSCENEEDFFITKWQTTTQNETVEFRPNLDFINIHGLGLDYYVDWGDGTFSNNVDGIASHVYETADVYNISVRGFIPAIKLAEEGDYDTKILEVTQWGSNSWETMNAAFANCTNMDITATDTPDLSDVSSCHQMFSNCYNLSQGLSNWDVSNVQYMAWMFARARSFNEDISSWDVSNVTDMAYIFLEAESFNSNINTWDVSNLSSTRYMFREALDFNQNLNSWNVSNVTDMTAMFEEAESFNQNLSSWDVSNVLETDEMFKNATNFNGNISGWNVSSVTNMRGMFEDATFFNQDLNSWNVSNVTDMTFMFFGAENFDQDLSSWDVSNVTQMGVMFADAESFNQDIGSWDVSNVNSFAAMFSWAEAFNGDISSWDVSSAESIPSMFSNAVNFNQDIGSWDVSNVTNMSYLFSNSMAFDQDLSSWDVSSVSNMNSMFRSAESFDQDLSSWDFQSVNQMEQFISYSGMSTSNYDLLLAGIAGQSESLQTFVDFGAAEIHYCQSDEEREILTTLPSNWFITDAGQLCAGCTGDIDGNGHVTIIDLSLLLTEYGTVGDSESDLNGDGVVSSLDLSILLGVFGEEC